MDQKKRLNETLIIRVQAIREKVLKDGLAESQISNNVENVSQSQNPADAAYVKNEDKELYGAINELLGYISFSSFKADETYDIPGVTIKINTTKEKIPNIAVKQDNIEKLAKSAKKFESLLGIKFPDQIYQFNHQQENIPGLNFVAPRPKFISESDEEYEQFLENYYTSNGLQKEELSGIWRKAYKHEQVDYKKDKIVVDETYQSEYYKKNLQEKVAQKNPNPSKQGGPKNQKAKKGEQLKIVDSELEDQKLPFWQKVGLGKTSIGANIKSGSNWQKIRLLGAGALLTTGVCYAAVANPGMALGLAATGGAIGLGVFIAKKLKPQVEKFKNWVNDALYGKPITNNEPTDDGESKETPPKETQEPSAPSEEQSHQVDPLVADEFAKFIEDAGFEDEIRNYKENKNRIIVLENEMQGLDKTSEEYKQKAADLAKLKSIQKDQLKYWGELLKELSKIVRKESNGGPKL